MKLGCVALLSVLLTGCGWEESRPVAMLAVNAPGAEKSVSLPEARRGFKTRLLRREAARDPVPEPPRHLFRTVRYDSPVGKLAAYVSQPPDLRRKHPAIIWIFGGFSNGISQTAWDEGPPENDQSASAFRKAGIVMMYPALRGGNDNPGVREGFLGEVDDILAAAEYLARQDFVDPRRIYLGGHSTGGTLALLVAASTDRFRAVFSFGPVEDASLYGGDRVPFDPSDDRERALRAPVRWLDSIRSPVFVFEGTESPGNLDSLQTLADASRNRLVRFHPVQRCDHFSILAPVSRLIAARILRDSGSATNIAFTQAELNGLLAR